VVAVKSIFRACRLDKEPILYYNMVSLSQGNLKI